MGAQSERIAAALRRQATQVTKMLALEIARELKRATPVDTGHAKRNWIPSVGQPNTTEATSGAEYAAGVAEVMRYELANGSLWVANVVPYIRRLNYGWSDQQPAGFVERAIDLAMQTVRTRTGSADVASMQSAFRQEIGAQGAENLAGAYSPFGGDE